MVKVLIFWKSTFLRKRKSPRFLEKSCFLKKQKSSFFGKVLFREGEKVQTVRKTLVMLI